MAIEYGITDGGFIPKRLTEIKAELEAGFKVVFGDTLDVSADSVAGQEIGVLSKPLAEIWENMNTAYNARALTGMSGSALDDLAIYRGITRRTATRSSVRCACITTSHIETGIVLVAGAQVRSDSSSVTFLLTNDVYIQKSSAIHCRFKIDAVSIGDVFTISYIDLYTTMPYSASYTAVAGDTPATVCSVLQFMLGQSGVVFVSPVSDTEAEFYPIDSRSAFDLHTVTATITLTEIGSAGEFISTTEGDISVPSNTVTTILTGSGWDRVYNPYDGTIGLPEETDSELRLRLFKSFSSSAAGTLDAIRNAVLKVSGVSLCVVTENDTGTVSGDLPPHGISVLVQAQAGIEQAIAEAIFASKPAGILTAQNGNDPLRTRNVTDALGAVHVIRYSAPKVVDVSVAIAITASNPDVALPVGWQNTVREAVVEIGNNFQLGIDIPVQSFFAAVYSVRGVGKATIRVTKGGVDYYDTTGAIVSVARDERCVFSADRVTFPTVV